MPKYVHVQAPSEMTEIPTLNQMKTMIENCPNLEVKVMAALLYVTGARISEAIKIDWGTRKLALIKKREIEGDKNSRVVSRHKFWFVIVPTLKNKKVKFRKAIMSNTHDRWAIQIIDRYYYNNDNQFPKHSRTHWGRLMVKYFNYSPHIFRHIRTTVLLKPPFNLLPQDMMTQNGWSSTKPLIFYMHLVASDYAHKF